MYMSEINNNETQRMYGYFENKNVCMMNPNFKDYYTALSDVHTNICLLYTSPSPRDRYGSRMPSSA